MSSLVVAFRRKNLILIMLYWHKNYVTLIENIWYVSVILWIKYTSFIYQSIIVVGLMIGNDYLLQLTIQYALWDKLKTLNDLTTKQLTNLAKFLTHLFLEKGLPLSVLKVYEYLLYISYSSYNIYYRIVFISDNYR